MEKHCKVIFLEDINGIIKIKNKNGNLFILSDEEIETCDFILNIVTNEVEVAYNVDSVYINEMFKSVYKKIIATTDTSLMINCDECRAWENRNDVSYTCTCKSLPQPPQQFIEKFIEEYNKGNVITEVDVEYLLFLEPGNTLNDRKYDKTILKVNLNNTINIKSAKDSWTREEVINLCRSAHLHGEQGALNLHCQTFKQWVEENL